MMNHSNTRPFCTTIATMIFLVVTTACHARNYTLGMWTISVDKASKKVDIYSTEYGDTPLFENVSAQLWIDKSEKPHTSLQAKKLTISQTGNSLTLRSTLPDNTILIQEYIADGQLLEVSLAATRKGAIISTNRMEPFQAQHVNDFMASSPDNRMLRIPWDNDAWVKFEQYPLTRKMDSFNVTALFSGSDGNGIIIGAIDHDTWKNAIHVEATDDQHVDNLIAISGFTSRLSRDRHCHGFVTSDTLRSSRFVVCMTSDWRDGMEQYAAQCQKVTPGRKWSKGVPVGWNSWGVMQNKITLRGVLDVADFMSEYLRPAGFAGNDGLMVLSLDSWWSDNISESQIREFVDYCHKNNFMPGLYFTPFADFATWDHPLRGIEGFTSKDIWLKVDDKPLTLDGAYALDPTHPATQTMMRQKMKKFHQWGIEYLKCDFMSHGALEADRWYNNEVTTGMQAYNIGMRLLRHLAGEDIFIDLSISPLFPYQYAHGRRICCDTFSRIDETRYAMNALTMGWWLNGLYFANDPDHIVLHKHDAKGEETIGENRARITSGVITGMYLLGDNFSDNVERGFPQKSRERALKLLTDTDINEIPRTCKSFRPVNGSLRDNDGAANLFSCETEKYIYVAAINYSEETMEGNIDFSVLGLKDIVPTAIRELWTKESAAISGRGFRYNVPAKDARVFRITK